jgi:TonB family protein
MMRRQRVHLLVALALMFGAARGWASEVKIIANQSVTADVISTGELRSVFLEEKNSLADGTHVQPVVEKDGRVHEAFLREYMGRTDNDLQTYYRALVFTGRGSMPKELGSDAEVVAYVAGKRGAIGYVGAETRTEDVKTLVVADAGSSAERKLIIRVEPEYPETLKRLNIGGTVRLLVTIAPKGNVEGVQLLGGNPILGESAIAAVKQWVYATGHSRTAAEVSIPFDPRR